MAKKAYIGVPKSGNYKVIDHIESTGEQYINTGFYATNNTKVVIDCEITYSSGWMGIFGSYSHNKHFALLTNGAGLVPYWGTTGYDRGGVKGRTTFIADKNIWTLGSGTTTFPDATFTTGAPMYIFKCSLASDPNAVMTLYSCRFYENGVLVRDFVPCINGNGEIGLYDRVNKAFYGNAGTGSFIEGTETGEVIQVGVARKVKKGYLGVDDVARKIKKSYIGIGGVARPCWNSGELEYWGTTTPLSIARNDLASTTVGNYALFGGGYYRGYRSDVVDAYNSSLTKSTPTGLSVARSSLASTTVGDYALFGGGVNSSYSRSDVVDAYNAALVRSTPTPLSVAREALAATAVGDYALFGGGALNSGYTANVDAYNSSLTKSTPTGLSVARSSLASTTVGDYALFGGGRSTVGTKLTKYDTVDAYNSSLTKSTPTGLSVAREALAATAVGDYALFGGGVDSSYSDVVDAYNAALVRSTPTPLSNGRYRLSATTVGNYALFGGGSASSYSDVVDAYNAALVRSTPTPLSNGRYGLSATTVGNYALFGGGHTIGGMGYENDGYISAVDVYTAEK